MACRQVADDDQEKAKQSKVALAPSHANQLANKGSWN